MLGEIADRIDMKVSGLFILALGVLAVFSPLAAGISLSLLFGAILFAGSIVHIAQVLGNGELKTSIVQLSLGFLYALAGISFIVNPTFGLTTLTIVLFAQLALTGALQIAWGLRSEEGKTELILSGFLSLVLASLIYAGWPSTATWVLGLFFGLNLIATGTAMILKAD
ncbi:HdeD family acid-resistance protein [Candidatus Nanohalococcus occultus]